MISITCALLATLLQQWARRYLKATQPRYSPHKRARIRAFFAEGVDKFLLPWAVEALPTMLHLSLFLFFAGLAVFLWNVNLTMFKLVLSWIGLCTTLYGCITFIPVFCHDSPYHTPLSLPVWHFVTGLPYLTFRALKWITLSFDYFSYRTYERFENLAEDYRKMLMWGMQKTAEESAFNVPPDIDTRAFLWTFDSLDEDHELERFFAGLPGFRDSKMVKDPLPGLTRREKGKLLDALIGLLDRTFSSNLLPEPVKTRRTVICRKAIGPADIPGAGKRVLNRIVSEDQYGPVQSAEIVRFVRRWDNGEDEETTTIIRAINSSVIARAQQHDDLWFVTAADEMGVPESLLRNHAAHGNNLSLAILIHIIHKQFSLFSEQHWPRHDFEKVLEAASKFDVLDTSSELQHEFCALWNQVIDKYQPGFRWSILRPICNIFRTLHLHTDSAMTAFSAAIGIEDDIWYQSSTYPLCNISGHHLDSTLRIHDVSSSVAIPRADNAAMVHASLSSTPDAPSPSITTPVHIDEDAVDVSLLDNILVPAPSPLSRQIATENMHDSASSVHQASAADTRDNPPTRTMAPSIRETPTHTASIPQPAVVSFQNSADLLAHSGRQETPFLASPEPVLDNIFPTGMPPALALPISESKHPSYPESHSSLTARTYPGTSPLPTFASELVSATSDEGSPKASSREHKDALDLPQVGRAIAVGFLSQPPLPSASTDMAIVGPSRREVDAKDTGDLLSPSHASHG